MSGAVLDDQGRVLWVPVPPASTELYPGLWLGGCAVGAGGYRDPHDWDLVVTCCGVGEEEPIRLRPGAGKYGTAAPLHLRLRMRDGPVLPDPGRLDVVVGAVVETVRDGGQVLCRCWAGLNRSALVAVTALTELTGLDGPTAIRAARAHRSPDLLSNPAFAAHIERNS